MKKMNFNIQMFGEEASFDSYAYNNMISAYDTQIPAVNQAFVTNQDALQVFKNAAGSPRLSELTKELINGLNTSIDETVKYLESVKGWASDVAGVVSGILKVDLNAVSATVDRTVLDLINENNSNGRVGLTHFADADTYIAGMKDSAAKLRNTLSTITEDVSDAKDSLPASVASAFSNTIATNNDTVLEGYDKLTEYLSTNVEEFKAQLQSAIDDMASAASSSTQ